LQAVARDLLPRGVTGQALAQLEDAWLPLLQPFPWDETQSNALELRGRVLFGIGARLLGRDPQDAEAAGALWSLADGAHHCSDPRSREFLLATARKAWLPPKAPRQVRPLTVLAALAAHDVRRGTGGPGRVSTALVHRLRGTFRCQS